MVSQFAMATTVRKVKQENRMRRQNQSQDEEGPYKPVPPPKPVPNNQKPHAHHQHQANNQTEVNQTLQSDQGSQIQYQNGSQEVQGQITGQPPAPEYRMPPLYGDEQGQGQTHHGTNLQTHSSKFPIEREVILSSGDKNSKIPILHEYKKRPTGRVAIAPDAPVKQQAWTQEETQMQELRQDYQSKNYQSQDTYSSSAGGAIARSGKTEDDKSKSLSRTYHTIKDMISSRFGPSRKETELEPEASLNNVAEDLRKSSRSINDQEVETKKKEAIYGKPSRAAQDPAVNMQQQYPKNAYGQYGHAYGYQAGQSIGQNVQSIQNVSLPGQLQPAAPIQPSLPGQSAQLHVSHHIPGGGVQTVHQTQIGGFTQPQTGPSQAQGMAREFQIPGTSGMHHSQMQSQPNVNSSKHGQGVIQLQSPSQPYQSPQQLVHQNQLLQSPAAHFAQQHAQNMHQRQLIQQMHQQQIASQQNSNSTPLRSGQQPQFQSPYQQQQYQVRQPISRSQIDLPSTSRQVSDNRTTTNQDMYYHYQGRPRYGVPQVYIKSENSNQDAEFQRRSSARRIEKAASQPQLSFEDERSAGEMPRNSSVDIMDKEKYEITVEERQNQGQGEFGRSGSQRKDEYNRPETSFGVRREEMRNSVRETDYGEVKESKEGSMMPKRVEELQKRSEIDDYSPNSRKKINESEASKNTQQTKRVSGDAYHMTETLKRLEDATRKSDVEQYSAQELTAKSDGRKDEQLEQGMNRLKIHNQGSGSDYDKAGQSSSNVDSGRGSAVYSSGRRPPPEDQILIQGQDSEWVDIVESELRSILEPRDVPAMAHSTLSESVSSVTPPLPPLSPHGSPRTPRNRYTASLPYGSKPNYSEYSKSSEKRNFASGSKHRGVSTSKKDAAKKFSHLFGIEAADLTSTTTGLDLESMLDRSDSDLSTNDARTIRKQLEGLENMYSEVLKLLGGSVKKRRKARGLASYGSVSSLPSSSVSSRPVTRHHDKRRSHIVDDRMKKAKDVKSINKRFQRLESHVVTLARSVAHLSSEMRTQHLMIQEMENIRGEISALRTQTSMAMVRSQSQPLIKDSDLPALSNPSRVKKLTKFFGAEPPLIRLFLRELGYEKYANAFEKEKVGMVELPYLSEERLQKMGVPLGPRLRILQEARISVCKDPVYVV
ncbi:uncharacterized protein LOC124185689 isoform X1 [Neodiprion fabricii]|uniref:uncharacterized protein LOC124185689 isoform X1 n=3 Tax=Neodiprion fabricii TaxID=2872261 RepID=UPI001ED919A7|nr:uncharacterized protein LOC124185689 isoform X1 [Neodiprion fabricii]